MRNGIEEKIHEDEILVGDIIKIKAGMNIPVDGVIYKAYGVTCDESYLTGETDEVKKDMLEVCKLRQ